MGGCLCLHCFHLDILNSGEKPSQSGNGVSPFSNVSFLFFFVRLVNLIIITVSLCLLLTIKLFLRYSVSVQFTLIGVQWSCYFLFPVPLFFFFLSYFVPIAEALVFAFDP